MMLSLDTAYRSFGGEVEASSTPTICRLSDSRRHQLSAIAPVGGLGKSSKSFSLILRVISCGSEVVGTFWRGVFEDRLPFAGAPLCGAFCCQGFISLAVFIAWRTGVRRIGHDDALMGERVDRSRAEGSGPRSSHALQRRR